ncbi:MAG TPA: hypothetical protein VMU12_00030 [Candidatus Paceibacterota bacterium]|nr:hypothetical protein [Candidatus Paceibacterota bacterium]
MPLVTFMKGDRFKYIPADRRDEVTERHAYGVVLNDGTAFVITGAGGRIARRSMRLDKIPGDALPVSDLEWLEEVPYEVKFALQCVRVAIA